MDEFSKRIVWMVCALLCFVEISTTARAQISTVADQKQGGAALPLDLQELARDARERAKADRIRRNSLERRIDRFLVANAPVSHVVFCLNRLGVNVCHERVAGPVDSFVDVDGVSAFATDETISMSLTGASVRDVLDEICRVDRRYLWTQDARRGLFIIKPRHGSRLDFSLGPVKESGKPDDVLARVSRKYDVPLFMPDVIRGSTSLPDVTVDLPRCTAFEFLNEIVAQRPGMTWRLGEKVTFNDAMIGAEAVQLEYPAVIKGVHSNSDWRYKIVDRVINGIPTVTVERQTTRAQAAPAVDPGATRAITGEDRRVDAPVARSDNRNQEQNVVASRLEGSWKLEPALTERLRGSARPGNRTMTFIIDKEVESKIPERFKEAAKREGITLEIRLSGYLEMGDGKFPFILTTFHGNPYIFYFRERGGDPFGDSESFNVMLAPAKDRKNDLLFTGGDFNGVPFHAFARDGDDKE